MPTTFAGTPLRHWLRRPGHLLVLFLVTTLGFLVGLGWLGWRTIVQDRQTQSQRTRERLESAADLIASDLRQTVNDVETQLERFSVLPDENLAEAASSYAIRMTEDALIVAFSRSSVQAFPRKRLLYYPVLPAADEPVLPPDPVARRTSQPSLGPAALEYFQAVAQSDDPGVRANALLDLARTHSALGSHQAALATYRELQDPDVLVAGRPAELWARLAVCELLQDLKATSELSTAVRQLHADLHGGRWQLTRAAYQNYATEVRRLRTDASLPADPTLPPASAQAIAASVDFLWSQWQEQGLTRETAASRITRVWNGQSLFLLWRATADRFVALVAGPDFVQDRFVEPVKGLADRQRVRFLLEDGEGRTVPSQGALSAATQSEVRTMVETRLPWTLRVVSANTETDEAEFSTRRQLVIAGLVFLALFVSAGSYLSVRAMTREMEAVQLKSDFVAAVSHEFRTPLTLLRQFSDLLVDDRVSSEQERRRYYAALQRGTRRLTRLVEDLLDFGRMEAGSRAYRFQRLDAQQWFTSVTREFAEEVHNKGYRLEVSWTCPPGLVLQADEEAIGRAFWNLLDNAVKYSPVCKTIWVSADFDGGRVTISVRDQGVGVPLQEHRAIFRKFVRGTTTNTQVVKGTGLGLALVEQIVEAHGGTVRLVSAVGEGSTFSIVLPASIEAQAQAQEQSKWLAS